ncbi:hypothetical protein GCM10010478_58740 [Streptomyces erythrogriseus]|uniref:Uncharacterized protein n=1 Tax=Streptomyces erythrogriseus TaxID=284027 RepID=A0ABN3XDB8_9ACTN
MLLEVLPEASGDSAATCIGQRIPVQALRWTRSKDGLIARSSGGTRGSWGRARVPPAFTVVDVSSGAGCGLSPAVGRGWGHLGGHLIHYSFGGGG